LVVSAQGEYTTIAAALADARDGDVIEVRGGVHPAIVVSKSVTLEGVASPDGEQPVFDGGGQGTVVALNAPGIRFRGFDVRSSGVEPDRDHSGVTLNAPRIVVENNRLTDVLFGVYAAKAEGSVIRRNDITSKSQYDEGRKGDGIRLWYSPNSRVEHNHVHEARDVVAWYSDGVAFHDNLIERGRYGIHLMYASDASIERNTLRDNSVGIYTMYSKDVKIAENVVRGHRGPSGYGLGFKDADNIEVMDNVLVDNRGGIFLDGMPFSPQGYSRVHDNIIAYNDAGAVLMPAVRRNVFNGNTFWENIEQVAVRGGGTIAGNEWNGNFWSDYAGFDANRDGVGDVPYTSERVFENLTDREGNLRALIYSPAAQAIEFAGAAMPIVRPQPKLTDAAPHTQPAPAPPVTLSQPRAGGEQTGATDPLGMFAVAFGLLGAGGLCMSLGSLAPLSKARPYEESKPVTDSRVDIGADTRPAIEARSVTKRYGKFAALEGVSFGAYPGEAIALWGANGAGKTTLLKAILGLIAFDGRVAVQGCDVRRSGKVARRSVGYVPQDVALYDMSVRATLDFFARLKKADPMRAKDLLARLGLEDHANKPVPALSGGLRQRLALAIALLADPPVLLLDEPTASLDAQAQREYLALLSTLCHAEGKTVVFASHRLEEVEMLAKRVLVLEQGRLVDVLSPAQLLMKLMPYTRLTLWVPEAQRPAALTHFVNAGLNAHLNGHGTVVVQVPSEDKMKPLHVLSERGIPVIDFEIERGQPWN
jgi:nitrous oxidase accessory protein